MEAMPTVFAPSRSLDSVEEAIAQVSAGRPVVVLGDEGLGQNGVLVFAADRAAPSLVAFVVRYSSGFLRVAIPESEADRLQLPPMVWTDQEISAGDDAVAVDAREGVTTGISATDRARTIGLLATATAKPGDFTRPGHVVPVRANEGGVRRRRAHAEAALDLVRLAGRRSAAAWSDIVSERQPARMAAFDELRAFADRHGLVMISIDDLAEFQLRSDRLVNRGASARIPLRQGTFTAFSYSSADDGREHIALVFGEVDDRDDVLVRVHFECIRGDVFGAMDCDCRQFLEDSLEDITSAGQGVLLYIRKADERHIDVLRVARSSLELRESAVHHLADGERGTRDEDVVAQILLDLGVPVGAAIDESLESSRPGCRMRNG